MDNDAEGLFHPSRKARVETSLEVENIYESIEALPIEGKILLILKLIRTLTIDEMADILEEIANRLRNTQ